ncbi:MAG: acetyl-CoA carboxylase biotin carboxylase subunit [Lewinella sp.]|nr:acetyl-CoA carboxylase biotin carboxylase subunit [Lewinella sp.]
MQKILVANRGEIALRIMRTARRMGIATVAVYSTADAGAPFVHFADESVCLGPPAASESYLVVEKILAAAQQTKAEAIHPGYGFLSENAAFAAAVEAAGLVFIGPRPEAIRTMGDKLAAKAAVKDFGVPLVPGSEGAIAEPTAALATAEAIGYPLLIKAAAGGGGKGMRVVQAKEEFMAQLARAQSEAQSAFGNSSVFIERFVTQPRHIEIQVLADAQGNTVHLFERECSIQRRHQKVIEEAPSSVLSPELRAAMGTAAVNVAKACQYLGAGTVEFLLDEQHRFYFLEMNTRLQVEHPVTEMITGLDLVEQQIRVARGESLGFSQEDLRINGHAIELRVYAEDPRENFLPSIGTLTTYEPPRGPGIRVDDGFRQGMTVPIYYDPLLAKLTVHAANRKAALALLEQAIRNYRIEGVANTLSFGRFVCHHPAFVSGHFDTHFVEQFFSAAVLDEFLAPEAAAAADLAALLYNSALEQVVLPNLGLAKFFIILG